MPLTIAIVEDDPAMLALLCAKALSCREFEVVFTTASCQEALTWFESNSVKILLVDLGLPDGSGVAIISQVSARYPGTDIIVISVFGDRGHVFEAIEAGASGYLLKDSLPENFVDTIQMLRDGGAPISPMIARQLITRLSPKWNRAPPFPPPFSPPQVLEERKPALTSREIEILRLVARGYKTTEVAELLDLSPHTIIAHTKKIYRKLHVRSRTEALFEAAQIGLLGY